MKDIGLLLNPGTADIQINVKTDAIGQITEGLVIGHTLYQNQALLLQLHKGELKEYPFVGVGIDDMLNDDNLLDWKREIILQMERDGMKVKNLEIRNTKLLIDADYK